MAQLKNYYLSYLKDLFLKTDRLISLVFFVTNKCNLKCSHCFYWKEVNKTDNELALEEIDKFSKSIGNFLSLSLTGGEPFLRNDIVQIAEIFYRNNQIRNLNIPTNGTLTERTICSVKEILSRCPNLSFNLGLSLDGLRETHDRIRQSKGVFDKALEIYYKIKDLTTQNPRLSIEIITVMSLFNQNKLDEFYDFVIGELKPTSVNLVPVRGEPKDTMSLDIDIGIYEKLIRRLQKEFLSQKISGYNNFSFSEYTLALRILSPALAAKIIKTRKYQTPCYAGSLSGVLYSNGDLFACELLDKKIGNIRETDYDFNKLWFSNQGRELRKYIKKTKCFCYHPCNFTVNILFNPMFIPQLLFWYIYFKLTRLRKQLL